MLAWFRRRFAADLPEAAATAARSSAESGSRRFLSTLQTEGESAIWACRLDDSQPSSPMTGMIIEAVTRSSWNRAERLGFRLLGDVATNPRRNGTADGV